jgi:hypothetical protein
LSFSIISFRCAIVTSVDDAAAFAARSFGLRLDPRLALRQNHRMRRRQIGRQ